VFYVGSVYGPAKTEFLRNIDALMFPTRYRDESWGIVLNEAMATGGPVITFDRGCTTLVVGERAGLVVPPDGNYVSAAVEQVIKWMDDAAAYRAASEAAIEQAAYLEELGQREVERFVQHMFPSTAVSNV
jgi:glycosyltransferase involved in cell wall biosynthesis